MNTVAAYRLPISRRGMSPMFVSAVVEWILDLAGESVGWRARSLLVASIVLLLIANILFLKTVLSVVENDFTRAVAFFGASTGSVLAAGLSLAKGLWAIAKDKGYAIPASLKWGAIGLLAVVVAIPAPVLLVALLIIALLVWRRGKVQPGGRTT